jgi:hypothetical protein
MNAKLEAYNEAKEICSKYVSYNADKRSVVFKQLERSVFECYLHRMNNFGKQLGLPSYYDTFHNK